MEEGQVKKERDQEFEELQQVARELRAQVSAVKGELAGADSLSTSLQQELQSAR